MILDISQLINVTISVAVGTLVATVVTFKLIGIFTKRALNSILNDEKVSLSMVSFVENTIVAPLNKTNNEDIKKLMIEALEVALGRIKKNE